LSLGSNFDAKQQIKQAVDIVDLVGSYLQLRREGRGFKAICPWHDDSRPSLQVNPERQTFKCWVCGDVGGDIFSFVMKMEGVAFPEAMRLLADRAGIRLTQPDKREQKLDPADDKQVLYQAMSWAFDQYHQALLHASDAEPARAYLRDRGISDDMLRKFKLGFSPDEWEWISQKARPTPYSSRILDRIGLISARRNGPGYYDRFKGRVLFPIFDSQARAVGLGGRVLPGPASAEAAKYINSPETPLYSKSNLLYGLSHARDAIRKTNVALVMEGYTDCVIAHQFGFENAVAVLGTALGSGQIRLLKRFADRVRIVLVLDGDEAGRRRASEILQLFVAENVDLRVLTLPDELDPCEFLLERGPEAFGQQVAGAVDALQHAMLTATAGLDLERDVHAASQALEHLVGTIAKAPRLRSDSTTDDRLREEKFLQRLAFDFRVPEEQVRARLTEIRRKPNASRYQQAPAAPASKPVSIDPFERELLEIVLGQPSLVPQVLQAATPERLTTPTARDIFAICRELSAAGIQVDFDRLLLEIDDPQVKNLLIVLDEHGQQKGASELEARLQDVLAGFDRRSAEQFRRTHTAALKERRLAEEDELAILKQLEQQERKRQGISAPTDG